MRFRENCKDLLRRIRYLFTPMTIIGPCLAFLAVSGIVCIPLILSSDNGTKDILIAIFTGILASTLVAIFMEMASNFQRNEKRWLQASRLFSALSHYEIRIDIATGRFDSERSHLDFMKKLEQSLVKRGEKTQEEADRAIAEMERQQQELALDEDDRRDRVACVFDVLPDLISLIEDAYTNHGDVFRRSELESMRIIMDDYHELEALVALELRGPSSICFGQDKKTAASILDWIPKRVQRDLDCGLHLNLAIHTWEELTDRIAKIIVKEGSLSLRNVGIVLSDALLMEGDGEDTVREHDGTFSGAAVQLVNEIDRELLQLQKIVKKEPGFGTNLSLHEASIKKYRIP